jgi:SSS family solute:Na+ symporter
MSAALAIIALTAFGALLLGLRASRGRDMSLEQWTVGGRGFGAVFVFLLMAGEIYGPTYYILGYGCLAYVISYWLLPPIWRYAQQHRLISQPDYFAAKYDSRALGVLVAVVGIVALIPYLVLQFKGLGIIVATASYGAIPSAVAVWIGAAVVTAYVMVSGVRGSAWTAVVKDALILAVAVFLGVYLPIHLYGGFGAMFSAIQDAKPGFLALPAKGESVAWFDSTVLLTALGFYMWPHSFGSIFTARTDKVFRQNAIVMPLYQLILAFVFMVGFAAVLKVPGLTGPSIDLALFRVSIQTFDPWFVGVIGAAGVLTALVPGSMIMMTAATLLANNIYRPLHSGGVTDQSVTRLARWMVPVVALVAVFFTLRGGQTIVALLLMGYSFVTQLFPALVMSLRRHNPLSSAGVFAGIVVGIATIAATSLTHTTVASLFPGLPEALRDLNIGIVALVLNVVTLTVVSGISRRVPSARSA